jgi:hypothetical protein
MQSKLDGDPAKKNFPRISFILGLAISLIFGCQCSQANAGSINGEIEDYKSFYYQEAEKQSVMDLQNGDFVSAENDSKVYIIMNGKKRKLAAEELLNIKHYYLTIKTLDTDVLDKLPEIKLAKVRGASTIYYLNNLGMKKLILNDAVFKSYGNRYEDIVEMEDYHLDLYPTVRFIKDSDNKVYQIKEANKKWVSTPQEFQRLGGNWSEISSVNDIELAAYRETQTGMPETQIFDGDVLRASNNMDVYIVKIVGEKKFKRLVLTPNVFNSYGHLKWENIKVVDPVVLEGFATSELVTMCSKAKIDADCDIYFLHDVYDFADSGYREPMAKIDFTSGKFDLDSVYIINETDFKSYRDSASGGEGTWQVKHIELLNSMLSLFKNRYGMNFRLDKNRFTTIMEKVVIKEREATTTGMREDFQKLISESDLNATETADLKYLMTQGAIYEKYFLDDAIASFDAGKVAESLQRKVLRQEITGKYPQMAKDFAIFEFGLGQIVQGKPVRINGVDNYFSKDSIEDMRGIYDENLSMRFSQLF